MKFMNINTMLSAVALLLMSANVFSASANSASTNIYDMDEGPLCSNMRPPVWENEEAYSAYYKRLKSAPEDDAQAAFYLGQLFLVGGQVLMGDKAPMKVKTNLIKAAEHFKRAADLRPKDPANKWNISAATNLGILYVGGRLGGKNLEEAAKYFKIGADGGNPISQYHLAVCFYNGFGIEKSNVECLKWMERAARQNYQPAKKELAKYSPELIYGASICYKVGMGVPADKSQALVFLKLAAAGGYPMAKEDLAKLGVA